MLSAPTILSCRPHRGTQKKHRSSLYEARIAISAGPDSEMRNALYCKSCPSFTMLIFSLGNSKALANGSRAPFTHHQCTETEPCSSPLLIKRAAALMNKALYGCPIRDAKSRAWWATPFNVARPLNNGAKLVMKLALVPVSLSPLRPPRLCAR